ERDVRARARRDSVHARNHRLRKRGEGADQRVPALGDGLAEVDSLARRDGAVVEVLPGTKSAAGARQDDDPGITEVRERVPQLLMHPHGEAVEPVRAVERDPGDGAVRLEVDGVVSHACRLAKEGPWTQTNSPATSRTGCSPPRAPARPGVSASRKRGPAMRGCR